MTSIGIYLSSGTGPGMDLEWTWTGSGLDQDRIRSSCTIVEHAYLTGFQYHTNLGGTVES